MLTTCENYDMLFTQFRRARLTAFHCGSLAWLQLCLSADPCIYTPGGDTTSAGGFVLRGRVWGCRARGNGEQIAGSEARSAPDPAKYYNKYASCDNFVAKR